MAAPSSIEDLFSPYSQPQPEQNVEEVFSPYANAPPQTPSRNPMQSTPESFPSYVAGDPRAMLFKRIAPGNGVHGSHIDGLQDKFVNPLVAFVADAEKDGNQFALTAAASTNHNANTLHATGRAADFWMRGKDGKAAYSPEYVAKLRELADKQGLEIGDEWKRPKGQAVWGGPHLHIGERASVPRENVATMMPSGRLRTGKQINDVIDSWATYYGIHDIGTFKNLLVAESNYQRNPQKSFKAVSPAGAVGIGQMLPETFESIKAAIGYPDATLEDYRGSENMQIKAAAYYYGQQLKQYGNSMYAAAAYNAGPGGLSHFIRKGEVDYEETKTYLSRIFNLPLGEVNSAFAASPTKYAWKEGRAQQNWEEQSAGLSIPNQVARGFFRFKNLAYTTDDDIYTANIAKHAINQGLLGLPGMLSGGMLNPDADYEKSTSMIGNVALGLPMQIVAMATGTKLIQGAGSILGNSPRIMAMASRLYAGAAAGKITGPVAEYMARLKDVQAFSEAIKWTSVATLEGYNHELGRQMHQGKNFDEASKDAWIAAMHDGGSMLLASIILPPAFLALGAGAKLGASIATGPFKWGAKTARSGAMGKMGQDAMGFLDEKWETLTEPVKDRFVNAWRDARTKMDEGTQKALTTLGVDTYRTMDQLAESANRFTSYTRAIGSLDGSAGAFTSRASAIETAVKEINQKYNQAQTDVTLITNLKNQMFADPQVASYANLRGQQQALEQQIQQLTPQIAQNPGVGKQVSVLQNQLRALTQQKDALYNGSQEVQKFEGAILQGQAAQDKLRAITLNEVWTNRQGLQNDVAALRAKAELHNNLARRYEQGISDDATADVRNALTLDPVIAGTGASLAPRAQAGLSSYADVLRAMVREDPSKIPVPKELQTLSAQAMAEMQGNPAAHIRGLEAMVQNARDFLAVNRKSVPKPILAYVGQQYAAALSAVTAAKKFPLEWTTEKMRATLGIDPSRFIEKMMAAGVPIQAFAGPHGVPAVYHDPTLMTISRENLYKAAVTMGTEAAIPSATAAREALEAAAAPRFHPYVDALGNTQAMVPGIAVSNEAITGFERALGTTTGTKDAFNRILQAAQMKLGTVDEVHGGTQDAFNRAVGLLKAGSKIGEFVEKHTEEALRRLQSLKPGQPGGALDMEVVEAIEGDKKAMANLIDRRPEMAEVLHMHHSFLSALERYKILSPEMRGFFRENYFQHIYPRMQTFMQRQHFDDLSPVSTRLSTEKERTVDTIFEARERARDAEDFLRSKGLTWEKFAFDFKNNEARGKAVGVADHDAQSILYSVLLGDAVTDPSKVIRQTVESSLRTDAVRHALAQLRQTSAPEQEGMLVQFIGKGSGPFEGPKVDVKELPWGMTRTSRTGFSERKPFINLSTLPGMGGYQIDGKPSNLFAIHPEAADFIRKYMLYTPDKGAWKGIQDFIAKTRAWQLMGSPAIHLFTVYSQMLQQFGLNGGKVAGIFHMGKFVEDTREDLMLRAARAGLQPSSWMANVKKMAEDLFGSPETSALSAHLYGTTPQRPSGQGLQQGVLDAASAIGKVANEVGNLPIRADHAMNKVTLFDSINSAQIGAWVHETSLLWQKEGPGLIPKYGYDGALYKVEQAAAQAINQRAGTMPLHWMSDTARQVFYTIGLAPQFLASKVDAIVGAMDGLTKMVGNRSRFASQFEPSLARYQNDQAKQFVTGMIVSDFLHTQLLSYLITGKDGVLGHSTFGNASPNSETNVEYGQTAAGIAKASSPLFRTFRSLEKSAYGLSKGEIKPFIDAMTGQLHGIYSTMGEFIAQSNKYGQPIAPKGMSPEMLRAWSEFFFYRMLPTQELPGISYPFTGSMMPSRDYPSPNSISGTEWALQAAGAFPTVETPYQKAIAKGLDSALRYESSRYDKVTDAYLYQAAQLGGLETAEGLKKIQEAIDFVVDTGVPITNKELAAVYKQYSTNGKGNYFAEDPAKFIESRIEAMADPTQAALKMTPAKLQGLLMQKIQESEKRSGRGPK